MKEITIKNTKKSLQQETVQKESQRNKDEKDKTKPIQNLATLFNNLS